MRGFFGGVRFIDFEGVQVLDLRGLEVLILRGLDWVLLRGLDVATGFAPRPQPLQVQIAHFPGAICTVFQVQFAPFDRCNLHHICTKMVQMQVQIAPDICTNLVQLAHLICTILVQIAHLICTIFGANCTLDLHHSNK